MTLLTFKAQAPASFDFQLQGPVTSRTGLPRLFAAAIVNDQFRETLLNRPEEALAHGYLGQTFTLTDREITVIKSVRADTLSDLAQKVNRALKDA